MIPSGSGRCPENRFRPGSRIVHLPGKTGNRITGIRFRPDTRYFCYDGSFSAALRRGRCRAQLFATKERYRCGLPLAGTHRPFFEPILFFLCQKEKNGFNLPRKERGLTAYRCLEFGSKDFSHQPSASTGCCVSARRCLTAIIKIACGA